MTRARLADALATRVVTLDGGLATQLEAEGHDLSSDLWSARLLAEDPDAVVAAHAAFFAAGAEVATTASYQASFGGLAAAGLDRAEATALLRSSVALAERARDAAEAVDDRARYVAASVGPYGAALADGSEYRGDYGLDVDALRRWHRPRLEVLAGTAADVLACETVPCLAEAEALVAELAVLGRPAWLSLTCDGTRTRAGEPVEEAFALVRGVDAVVAVGVNCTAPDDAGALVALAARASGKPVVVYPNSGEGWDAERRRWAGEGTFAPDAVRGWLDDGARLVGGCCRVTPADIGAVHALVTAAVAG
ncbi:homocysteine S-methyltransferase [Friedmanniella luteola]|uniref:Homocysteine S-methyltransferase n=1 Tax=Friedmanniella luteola TaxID=546871 RepID=A0A1H1L1A2_9ACTN|nr:homocysteine S-methyltransferase [Friedmanniella luteola]SDR68378.1 homocysteine S-methyltransferase [Friedmanniella luteola]